MLTFNCQHPLDVQHSSLDSYRIVFSRGQWSTSDLFQINGDGQNLVQLTADSTYDTFPVFSPDGKKIMFTSSRHGGQNIYMMSPNGSEVKRLTFTVSPNDGRDWSPDGKRIAYSSGSSGVTTEIFLADTAGLPAIQMTSNNDPDYSATWSPGGNHIAFHSTRQPLSPRSQVYVMDIQSRITFQFSDSAKSSYLPEWNPVNNTIAYVEYDPTNSVHGRIVVQSLDGSHRLTVAHHYQEYRLVQIAWSRDGLFLAAAIVDSVNSWKREVYAIEVASGRMTNVSTSEYDDVNPSWSPDGLWIAFSSPRTGKGDIYAVRRDGTDLTRITDDPSPEVYPVFSPIIHPK